MTHTRWFLVGQVLLCALLALAFVLLLSSSRLSAQHRWTNADLGRKIPPAISRPSAETLAGLKAREWVGKDPAWPREASWEVFGAWPERLPPALSAPDRWTTSWVPLLCLPYGRPWRGLSGPAGLGPARWPSAAPRPAQGPLRPPLRSR